MSERPFSNPNAAAGTDLVAPRARPHWELLVALTSGRQEHTLIAPCEIVVGRGAGATIVVEHGSVSREHARIVVREEATIEDLGSSNGTRLDGRRLEQGRRELVRTGSVIELGDVMMLLRPPEAEAGRPADGEQRGVGVEMARAVELADAAARSSLNVYISGEHGSGRTWLAERIHRASPRAGAAIVRLSSSDAGEDAVSNAIAEARGGVLILEEPQLLERGARALLEGALASGVVTRGDGSSGALDARVLTTSTMSPQELVAGGIELSFASRLFGITIEVPPLRARRGEIRHLAETTILEAPRAGLRLTDAALGRLLLHHWPGNVEQLREVVLRAAGIAPGSDIRPDDIVFAGDEPATVESAASVERNRVLVALEICAGNQTKAAQLLGISRRTLINRLDQLGVPRPRKPVT